MNTINIVLGILLLVMAVFLVITILLQSSKDHRISGTIMGSAETFFGKQKGKTIDGVLNKLTAVVCILFFVSVLAMYVTSDNTNKVSIPDNSGNIVTDGQDNDISADADTDADANTDSDADANTDADADANTDADADANTDANTNADANTDANTNADANADADTNADANADADTNADANANANTEAETNNTAAE